MDAPQAPYPYNPLALARLMGPTTPTLDRLVRFLGSVRGTDKVLMFIQYFTKIVIWYIQRTGSSTSRNLFSKLLFRKPTTLTTHLKNLAGPVSDFRILLRYYGLVPLVQYMAFIEHHPPTSQFLLHVERLQNLCNLIYYPLEHAYWLGAHNVLPLSKKTTNRISIWSCRFWAAYVLLQYVNLEEQRRIVNEKEANLARRIKAGELDDVGQNRAALMTVSAQRRNIYINYVINTAYLPLTIHWSLENSSFPDIGVGICGTIAAICQLYTTWESS
ncbi:peroxisomal biogenesis factor 11 [Jimgerdemannia flammicorona]|uniref:Peroxisomal biogenesis factor 11 n=1 Tax=Jimgerdemannia flammicorona TaxID=994334 RepID=A0A433D651_9FUNG|nr:peroxisomal biogenesis factor 11 [Jimgerdemannia flammicorona]